MPSLKSKVVFGDEGGGSGGDGGDGGDGSDGGDGGDGGGAGGGQGMVQSALAAIESTPTVTTASNSLLIVHTWMAMAAPAISYDSPSASVVQSSDGTPLRW
eukprot:scaffold30727_cov58-Phaeocystis_antarctica.AAC.1